MRSAFSCPREDVLFLVEIGGTSFLPTPFYPSVTFSCEKKQTTRDGDLPSEGDQGYDLAFGEGGLGSGPLFRPTGLAEVVGDDVECGEEGILNSTMRVRFLSLRDRWASRL